MKQQRAKTLNLSRQSAVNARKSKSQRVTNVTFGSVTVVTTLPSPIEVARNIRAGQEAIDRGLGAFLKPGVKNLHKETVPLFSADPENPEVIIRTLNGKTDKGKLNRRTGAFEVCP